MSEADEIIAAREKIRVGLVEWCKTVRDRDRIVREAVRAGLTFTEVSEITGLARTTLYRICAEAPRG